MFGMMFGDVGHGLLLVLLALVLRRSQRIGASLRSLWPLPAAAGVSAAIFGLLYGAVFGPTGLIPALWLDPVDEPLRFLAIAVGVGAVLLTASYAIGIVNRWREGGWSAALLASSGFAGLLVLVAGALAAAAWYLDATGLWTLAAITGASGAALLLVGFLRKAGRGATAVTEAAIEVVDTGVRLVANVISFTRLAAFGLMHAVITAVVFDAASAIWGGLIGSVLAVIVFCIGNILAFSLGVLIAGVQALRLEYYELFSRVFAGEGQRFEPWRIPVTETQEAS
jgi:V/A-type H+-transporting ATPase subunit I